MFPSPIRNSSVTPQRPANSSAVPVSDGRRVQRRRVIKSPYDPITSPYRSPFAPIRNDNHLPTTPIKPKKGPPSPLRQVVEVSQLRECMKQVQCKSCRAGKMDITFPVVRVACRPSMICTKCKSETKPPASTSKAPKESDTKKTSHSRLTDYAANVLFVISFLCSGDGGSEAQKLLGLLDLPNCTSMEKSTFSRIERVVAPVIIELANECLFDNLVEEIKVTPQKHGFILDEWKLAVKNKDKTYPTVKFATVRTSADTGWQKRASGRRYDSLSGHTFFFGVHGRNPLLWDMKLKHCKVCSLKRSKGDEDYDSDDPEPDHECHVNHNGSSKAMEPLAVVDMTHSLFDNFKCEVANIITDDDSTMKANCRWNNDDYQKAFGDKPRVITKEGNMKIRDNTGKLRGYVPQPLFLGDPSHRKKTFKKHLYALKAKTKGNNMGCMEVDILRLATNFAHMVRQLPITPKSEWTRRAKAVLDHYFDIHTDCGDFCCRKDMTEEERSQSTKFYRSTETDKKLYSALQEILARFIGAQQLDEVGHGFDTNANESFNQSISWFAPKNKTYSGTCSLMARIAVAVCIRSLGMEGFYSRLFKILGIEMTKGTEYWLKQKSQSREKRLRQSKEAAYKRKRKDGHYRKLKEETLKAEEDRQKHLDYETGCAITGDSQVKKKRKKTPKKNPSELTCNSCGLMGHGNSTSLKCANNKKYRTVSNKVLCDQLLRDVQEQEVIDSIGPDADLAAAKVNVLEDLIDGDISEEEIDV